MKSAWSLPIAGAVLVLILYILSSTGKKAPHIPSDTIHRILTTQEACVECHASGKPAQLNADHPLKEQCLLCHKVKPA